MEDEVKEETLPPGFRFHPTDEELITYYLVNKISDSTNFTARAIGDVDLNKSEPWDLPGVRTGVRTNRATNTGYWKTTGKDKEIFNSSTSELVGMKKTLVFYRGRAPRGEKTNWVMHEYRIHSKSSYRTHKQDEWVVCRVFQKSAGGKKYPCNNSRAVNMNPYTLEINPSTMSSQIIQADHIQGFQLAMGRGYMNHADAEIQEFNRVFRGGSSSSNMSFPVQSQMNYSNLGGGGGNYFTISGLNLNLGSDATTSQPTLRPMLPPQVMNQQDMMTTEAGYGSDMNNSGNTMNRFMAVENCADNLENYWSPY